MSRRMQVGWAIILVVALVLSSAPLALAQEGQGANTPTYLPFVSLGSTRAPQNVVTGRDVPLVEQQAALVDWTCEHVAAATAAPLPVVAASELPDEGVEPASSAELVLVAPGRAAANADRIARAAYPDDWATEDISGAKLEELAAGLEAEAAAMAVAPSSVNGTGQTYTSFMAHYVPALQTVPPHKYIGRFVSKNPQGKDFTCSATAIRGNNVVTAAHCVYSTASRAWHTQMAFLPAYRYGSRPYGTFAISTCRILVAYQTSTSVTAGARYDIAVCKAGNNSAGQALNTAVGSSGYGLNSGTVRSVVSLGYPGYNNLYNHETSNQGLLSWPYEYLRLCAAETFSVSADVRGMGCNWGAGASGGPWIETISLMWPTTYGTFGYAPGLNSGYVTGVNSYVSFGIQNIYAPIFTTANLTPLCQPLGC